MASSSQSVQWSGRCGVHELPDRIGDPPPDRCASPVTILYSLRRPYRTLRLSLIAVALQHQVGQAPYLEFRDHTGRLFNES